jgi:arsenite-transporting ATPase
VANLFVMNIDPEAAAREYRERVVGPYRAVLPGSAVARIEEQLSGACTMEIAAFDQFTRLLADPSATATYDHVVFDTAPTGHTLRLLKLPAAWTGFIDTNTTGTSCLGPLAGLQGQVALYRASVAALSDPEATTVVIVARPERTALAEAARTSAELRDVGIGHQHLIVNGVFTATDRRDPLATALEARGRDALAATPAGLDALPRTIVPLLPWAPLGIPSLRGVFGTAPPLAAISTSMVDTAPLPGPLSDLIDEIDRRGRGVILSRHSALLPAHRWRRNGWCSGCRARRLPGGPTGSRAPAWGGSRGTTALRFRARAWNR